MMFESKVTRRNLVQAGLMAGILPIGSWASAKNLSLPETGRKTARLHKLLVDRNIPESVRLGAYAGAIADEVFEYDGDLTRLWHEELRSQWPNGPRPIGGLTTPDARFVLEQLGRDHDARIVFSAEHRKVAGSIRHSLVGSDALLQSAEFFGDTDWVAEMAKLIVACPHQPPSMTTSFEYETSVRMGLPDDHLRLMTWVLAPISPRDQRHNSETVNS